MGGGSWKVAYADFVTAMMAFFLLMWILNMTPKETQVKLAGMFRADAFYDAKAASRVANNPLMDRVVEVDAPPPTLNENEQAKLEIALALKTFLLADAVPSTSSGITSDNLGVMLHTNANLMFAPNTVQFTDKGKQILDNVTRLMNKFKVFIVVRGHADSRENPAPYPSLWELSAARANAAVEYLVSSGVDATMLRSVAYADTKPVAAPDAPDSLAKNSRVEFTFHRPEVGSNIVGY